MNHQRTHMAEQQTAQARHVRIDRLQLKIPYANARAAKRLANAVASRLAAGAGELHADRIERIRTRVVTTPAMSEDALAAAIAEQVKQALFQGRKEF